MEVGVLKTVPIFSELELADIETIIEIAESRRYKKDSMILMEEEAGRTFFIILDGKVKISRISDDGREVILSILREGDFFGEISILDGMARSANVTAFEDSELILIRKDAFFDILYRYPQVSIALLKELASRIRKSDSQIKSLSLKDATGKVANAILMLASNVGQVRGSHVEILGLPLQQDMANMAGTSRETISRVLKNLIEQGYVVKSGNKLVITDFDKFKRDFS